MISYEERREVARRLRGVAERNYYVPGGNGQIMLASMFRDIKEAISHVHGFRFVSITGVPGRLADLIEPPTLSSAAMRAEADELSWERCDCDGTVRELRRRADEVDAACAPVDRAALLELAGEMDAYPACDDDRCGREMPPRVVHDFARRIREALGVE